MTLRAEPGDVGFAAGNGWLQRAIRLVETSPGEAPTLVNHSLLFTRAGIVGPARRAEQAWAVEALGRVEHNPWYERHAKEDGYHVQVFRPLFLNWRDTGEVVVRALQHKGQRYGWWKLAAHLGDRYLFAGRSVLGRLLCVDSRPICSYLVGAAFEDAGYPHAFNGVPARAQTPDYQHDYVMSNNGRWSYIGEATVRAA